LNGGIAGGAPTAWGDTRGLAPSVGARAETASATSNAHPLRHDLARQESPVYQLTGSGAPTLPTGNKVLLP
jgi:hypothetical protein